MIIDFCVRIFRSAGFYPVTGFYLGAVSVLLCYVADKIDFETGLLALSVLAVSAMVYSMRREVKTVHGLVDTQRTELLGRIDQLLDALHDAGVPIPAKIDAEHRVTTTSGRKGSR